MWLLFIITFNQCYSQDALLQAIYGNWYNQDYQKEYEEKIEAVNLESNDGEGEHLSWQLGTPDNLPELEIYYEPVCEVVCR